MSDKTDGMLNPHRKSKKFWCGFDSFTDTITAALFTLGAIAMFLMVVTRYGFSWSDPSVEILVRYSVIWGTFVGIAAAVRFSVNIRFTLVEHLFQEKGRRIIQSSANVLTLILAVGLALSGITLTEETMMFDERMPTSLRWFIWPFHAAIFFGGCLLAVQVIRTTVDLWRPIHNSSTETR